MAKSDMTQSDYVFRSSLDKYTFDPSYPFLAKSFGFNPFQPLKLLPKPGDPYSCPERSAEILKDKKNGVSCRGRVFESMEVEIIFEMEDGPLECMILGPTYVSATFRQVFPESVMASCKGRKLRDFVGFENMPEGILDHKISEYEINFDETLIKAMAVDFIKIDQN